MHYPPASGAPASKRFPDHPRGPPGKPRAGPPLAPAGPPGGAAGGTRHMFLKPVPRPEGTDDGASTSRRSSGFGLAECSALYGPWNKIGFVHNPYSFGGEVGHPVGHGSPLGPAQLDALRNPAASVPAELSFSFCPPTNPATYLSAQQSPAFGWGATPLMNPGSSYSPLYLSFLPGSPHLAALTPCGAAQVPHWPPAPLLPQGPAGPVLSPYQVPAEKPAPTPDRRSSPGGSILRLLQPQLLEDLYPPPVLLMPRHGLHADPAGPAPGHSDFPSPNGPLPAPGCPPQGPDGPRSASPVTPPSTNPVVDTSETEDTVSSGPLSERSSKGAAGRSRSAPAIMHSASDDATSSGATPKATAPVRSWKPSPNPAHRSALQRFKSGLPPCTHPKPWKRLRAKRGTTFFACLRCDARLRVSYPADETKADAPEKPDPAAGGGVMA